MRTYLLFLSAALVTFLCCNNDQKTAGIPSETQSAISNGTGGNPLLVGQWKKVAYGQDANKNGMLEDNEKEKRPEAGSFEQLNFYKDGKYMYSGILGEIKGKYDVKPVNGKNTILMYTDDMPGDLSEKEKLSWATKFEIRSLGADKLVVVPPIYLFMLVVYARQN